MKPKKNKSYGPIMDVVVEKVLRFFNRIQRWCFIKSDGRIGNSFMGAPVGLLTTTGRKSGLKRQACLVYYTENNKVAIVASKAGCIDNPVWYLNLHAMPECTFQIGRLSKEMIAHTAEGEEYDHFWQKMNETYADFETYKSLAAAAGRAVPLVILEPATTVK